VPRNGWLWSFRHSYLSVLWERRLLALSISTVAATAASTASHATDTTLPSAQATASADAAVAAASATWRAAQSQQ